MKEWLDPNEKMHSYFAYEIQNGSKQLIGFVHFQEKQIDGKPVIYIAQVGVNNRGQGVGKELMECVLSHYKPGMEFRTLTRVFNVPAVRLYKEKLGFSEIASADVKALGYDERYCGFQYISTQEKVESIISNKTPHKQSCEQKI